MAVGLYWAQGRAKQSTGTSDIVAEQWTEYAKACAAVVPPGVECITNYETLACGTPPPGVEVVHMDHFNDITGVSTNVIVRKEDAHKVRTRISVSFPGWTFNW